MKGRTNQRASVADLFGGAPLREYQPALVLCADVDPEGDRRTRLTLEQVIRNLADAATEH